MDDAGYFHGRDRLINELLDACAGSLEDSCPLVVVGPSGAGKTSLLHAGLLAALRGGGSPALPGSAGWPCAVLTPGEHPVRVLAAALHPDGVAGGSALRADPQAAARLVPQLVPGELRRLVLVVDQLEELFTICRSRPEQTAFVSALEAVARAGALVVMALRADFYGQAQTLPELAAALRDHQVLAGPLHQEELRAAIERPAAAAGLDLDEGLSDLLLHELGAAHLPQSQAGTLPLLSHALWATWRQRSGRRLTLAGYRASGGIARAIATTADEAYARLDEVGRRAVRHMLPRLVRIADETVDTTQPADWAALLDGLPDPQAAESALHQLAAARLLVLDEHTVRISHNALLHAWPLLRQWIDADRDWLRVRQQIAADADVWWQTDKDPSLLYRGTRLAAARDSVRRAARTDSADQPGNPGALGEANDPDPRLTEFLGQSWRHERRGIRIRRMFVAGLCALALLASAGGTTAWMYQRQAVVQRGHAVARLVAAEAETVRGSQPGLAKQLSLIAYRMDPDSGTASLFAGLETPGVFNAAESARDLALSADGTKLAISTGDAVALWDTSKGHGLSRLKVADSGAVSLSPDGRLLAAAVPATQTNGTSVRLWDVGEPSHPKRFAAPSEGTTGVSSLAFSPDGRLLALGRDNGGIRLWDVTDHASPRPLRTLTGHTGNVDSLAFAPSGRLLASAGEDGTVRLWDPRDTGRTTALSKVSGVEADSELAHQPLHRVAFSPDGQLLAAPGNNKDIVVRLWDVGDPARPGLADETDIHSGDCDYYLVSVAFNEDGTTLAAACGFGTAVWDVTPRSRLAYTRLLPSPIRGGPALFAPHGHGLIHATRRGVFLWHAENTRRLGAAASLDEVPAGFQVTALFSGGPRRLLIVQGMDRGYLWDMTGRLPGEKLADLPGSGSLDDEAAAFSPDGRILAVSEIADGQPVVRLRDTTRTDAPVISTVRIDNGVSGLSFSADGRLLAISDNDDTPGATPPSIRLYDVSTPPRPRQTASMKGGFFGVAFAPTGRLLVAGATGAFHSWTVTDPRHPTPHPNHGLTQGSDTGALAFRPDGGLLAVSDSRDVRLWRIEDGRISDSPTAAIGTPGYADLAFNPDSRTLALGISLDSGGFSANTEAHIELWDISNIQTPVYRASFAEKLDTVGSLSYSPQDTTPLLVGLSGPPFGTVDVWDTSPKVLTELLCQSIGDVITPAQWKTYVPNTPYDPPCAP